MSSDSPGMSLVREASGLSGLAVQSSLDDLLVSRARLKIFRRLTDQQVRSAGSFGGGEPIYPERVYLTITIRRIWLPNQRLLWATYYPLLHFSTTVPRPLFDEPLRVHAVATPEPLAPLPSEGAQEVQIGNRVVLDRVPYFGGVCNVWAGLVALECNDMGESFLGLLTDIAKIPGAGALSSVMPLFNPLKLGVERLMGMKSSRLALGVLSDWSENEFEAGCFLAMNAPTEGPDRVDPNGLHLDAGFAVRDKDERHVDRHPYVVFTLEQFASKTPDSPEIREALRGFRIAASLGEEKPILEAWKRFRHVIVWSPDLLPSHGHSIVREMHDRLQQMLDDQGLDISLPGIERGARFQMLPESLEALPAGAAFGESRLSRTPDHPGLTREVDDLMTSLPDC